MKKSKFLVSLFIAMILMIAQVGAVFAAPALDDEPLHPVGDALAAFFSDITDYETIMAAHKEGFGFGTIAQALWLTQKYVGDSEELDGADIFYEILLARETGDYSFFTLEDGTAIKNWGQFKKAILDGDKKGNLGVVISSQNKDKDKSNNGNGQDKNKDKGNNGENGSINGNKDKEKDK